MLKFTMNTKELKAMMEKGMSAINKKAALSTLTKLYFQVEENGTVKALGTDMEHFAEIRTNNAWNTSPGVVGIDVDDIKVLSKMSGVITLEDVSTEKELKINIKCGKKNVKIPKYENTDIFLPDMDNSEGHILTVKENWLLDTVTNLALYTVKDDPVELKKVFNFNVINGRVEALEGHMIGIRSLDNQKIEITKSNVMIHNRCIPVFKKILDKKSESEVKIYQDKKYIRVEGTNFTYVTRKVDGKYYDISKFLDADYKYSFVPDRKNFLEVMKYNCDLIKGDEDKKPVILHSESGKLYSYMRTSRYEAFDELESDNVFMAEDFYIGFNPDFLMNSFNIVDADNPVCKGCNNKSPLLVEGNEYSFVILPVYIKDLTEIEKMSEYINRCKVA